MCLIACNGRQVKCCCCPCQRWPTTTRRFRLAEHGWMNSCLESPSFCSLTFAPLTSNTLQLFISPPTLAASVLCKSLSHRRPDWCSSRRVSDGETGCISEGETSIILSPPPPSSIFLHLPTPPNADVFISLIFPPAIVLLMEVVRLLDISQGSHTHANSRVFFASFLSWVRVAHQYPVNRRR